ncbi:heterokaryon incompatibility protein-domain-containing protein [Achaetomium macrosporum]|uniref:Heterokaryon incompatibility protein-domain-containing protein n=1 Tax=Achaetomium macrosporum TaxID=79813 RepID=A0AAN7C503_9PEZI|nr:heterokaryon incompatibility protein-domain-containing protein [Achaetomium macrosporum]
MRLLETSRSDIPKMHEFVGSQIPPYAILSHTWEDDEVTMQQLAAGELNIGTLQAKTGFRKIHRTCELARTWGLRYAWVDTCCIDKTSSAELTEAINSMFAWYRDAWVCYVFLADLEHGTPEDLAVTLPKCRWFTRGWTLQELIAPREVFFYDKEWNYRGSKRMLASLLSTITGVPEALLRHDSELRDFAVARRMSWAARRKTTRLEDMAYCLLGIFDVNMSLIYGEGMKAFQRLQAAIVETTLDLSILAWTDDRKSCPPFSGVLAESPIRFAGCGNIELVHGDSAYVNLNFTITTRDYPRVVLDLFCILEGRKVGICLRKIGEGLYARYKPNTVLDLDSHPKKCPLWEYPTRMVETLILVTRLPHQPPRHLGLDPAVGNRSSVLRINWGPLVILDLHVQPQSHWDMHDGVFFNCNVQTRGWGALFVRAQMRPDEGPFYPSMRDFVWFFLACFSWLGQPILCMADLHRVDSVKIELLESRLNQVKFETCWEALNLVRRVLADRLRESKDHRSLEWDPELGQRLQKEHGLRGVKFTSSIYTELRPDLCANPVSVLNIESTSVQPPGV